MTAALLTLLATSVPASLGDAPAHELHYRGTLAQVDRNESATPVKRFEVYCLVRDAGGAGPRIAFLVDEREGGGWAWPERFGEIVLDAQRAPASPTRARLLYDHEGTLNPLPLPPPLFEHAGRLQEGAEWAAGGYAYEVTRSVQRGERDCWQVDAANNFGRSHTLWIEKASGLVVALEQRVFMGRGDRFSLSMNLESLNPLDAEALARVERPLESLLSLQKDLDRKEGAADPQLTEDQLAASAAVLEQLTREAEATPFGRFVSVVARDVQAQQKQAVDLDSLVQKFVGQAAPELDLFGLNGKPLDPADREGRIVVLHFWKYHGEPLSEPYGQVGYLDFLNNRRRRMGVRVYGVAVDERFSDDSQRRDALRQVKSLQEFMNLSYPIATDAGSLLRKFGDPQRVGGRLPLWVVIGPDGRIAHYKSGFYDITPDEGLRELDEVLAGLIRAQRDAAK